MTELGNRLKEAREARGLTLDDLQNVTKIQKRYLVGIEEGNYAMMPGKFYVRAFIKQYCEAVGLEPEEIFDTFKNDIPAVHNDEMPELSRVKSRKTIDPGNSKIAEMLPKILVGAFVIGAVVLVWVLFSQNAGKPDDTASGDNDESVVMGERKDSPLKNEADKEEQAGEEALTKEADKQQAEKPPAPETEVKVKQELASVSSSGRDSSYQLKNAETFKVKLLSKGTSWVNIKNGKGHSFYQGTLQNNASQEVDLTNETQAVLIIGNAADTEIYVNGEKLAYSVSPQEIVRQDITIDFVKAE
ncbi:helix-turn-helix domain-containing protein [Peribacillus saganii]|uniref:Helix-turn-helix domain-containing protein n=1 Tax=Peribacillus saganii TaxID=2303992 RepID=A0A372LUV5_9BACI|nr:helix-turn-helix domain-containing protein [Peribacillus saganii]